MAETNENVQETGAMSPEVLEALVFNQPIPAQAQPEKPTTETPAPEPVVLPEPSTQFNESEYLKQHFGAETLDALKSEYEELKKLKDAPPPAASEITFSDEQSKKIHNLLREGKTKEVKAYLDAQELLSNLDSMDTEKQLKLYIKMQNPLFDEELIQDEYDSLYKIDEEKFKVDEEVDHLKLRKEKLRMQQRLQNDVAKAQDFFTQYKTKIELPDITPQQNIDNDYEDYKAGTAKSIEVYNNVIAPSLNALKETDVQLSFKVEDPNNQMNFDISVLADKADFEKARKSALSYNEYIDTNFSDEKGFNGNKLIRAILLEQNFDKYAQTIARQAVNAERRRVIEKESAGGGVVRDFNVSGKLPTEVEQAANMAFSV